MRLSSSAKLLRQRAVAIALLAAAVFAVAAITITTLSAPHAGHGVSLVAQAIGGVLILIRTLVCGCPSE